MLNFNLYVFAERNAGIVTTERIVLRFGLPRRVKSLLPAAQR